MVPSSATCNTQNPVTLEFTRTDSNTLIRAVQVGLNIPSGWLFVNPKPTKNDLTDIGGMTWKPTAGESLP